MKKLVIVGLLAVVTVFGAFANDFISPAAGVDLTAKVDKFLDLTVPADYTATDIAQSAETGATAYSWSIGNVVVKSNMNNWTISLSSVNDGVLKTTVDSVDYTIGYTVTLGTLLSTPTSLATDWTSAAQSKTTKSGVTNALAVAFTSSATEFYQAGTYSDTITVTVSQP